MYRYFFMVLIVFTLVGCNKKSEKELKFYGNVDVRTVSVAFQVPGRIDNIYFEEGQKIKKGDVLATLDSALYEEKVNQMNAQIDVQKVHIAKLEKGYRPEEIEKARATMEQKKALMINAKKTFNRYKTLLDKNSTSQDLYDKTETAYKSANSLYHFAQSNFKLLENGYEKEDILSAKAQLKVLLSQRNQNALNLDYTTLYAPSNGTILTRVYEVGSIVNASSVVLEIAKEDKYWVRSYISEKYLGNVKAGMNAFVYTDSGKTYEGVVSFISPLAEFTPKSVQTEDLRTDLVYRFRITLNSYDEMIKQGMPVTIKFSDLKTDTQ